jgi:hypothetical protein
MAASKTTSYIVANTSVQAAATYVSGAINVTSYYGTTVTTQTVTQASAGTLPCTITINASPEGTYWFQYQTSAAGVVASTTYPLTFYIDPSISFYQVQCIGSSGGGTYVVFSAQAQNIIGI